MSELEPGTESVEPSQEQPLEPAEGLRACLLKAGEWLQRPPGKHMGPQTTLIVLVLMLVLVIVGSWFGP